MARKRNRDLVKNYQHMSLTSIAGVKDTRAGFADMDTIVDNASEEHRIRGILELLRNRLAEWKL